MSENHHRLVVNRRTSWWVVLLALLCAAAVAGAAMPVDHADAQKKDSHVGKYRGTFEMGGTVSFRFTKSRRIVGFTATDLPWFCLVDAGVTQPDGTHLVYVRSGTVTFVAPTMKVEGVAKFFFSNFGTTGNHPQYAIEVNGKPGGISGGGLKGYVDRNYEPSTTNISQPGSCTTYRSDWTARKVGGK